MWIRKEMTLNMYIYSQSTVRICNIIYGMFVVLERNLSRNKRLYPSPPVFITQWQTMDVECYILRSPEFKIVERYVRRLFYVVCPEFYSKNALTDFSKIWYVVVSLAIWSFFPIYSTIQNCRADKNRKKT